jgi:hypothetical protein
MRVFGINLSVGLIALGMLGVAQAQTNPIQGTPASLFPHAGPNEVTIINGVPCRTVYDRQLRTRVPVVCAGDVHVGQVEVSTTGSTDSAVVTGVPIAGTPDSLFPHTSPNEIRMINGVPCRTMYDRQLGTRVPIACAGDVSVRRVN